MVARISPLLLAASIGSVTFADGQVVSASTVSISIGDSKIAPRRVIFQRNVRLPNDIVLPEATEFIEFGGGGADNTISGGHGLKITGQRDGQGKIRISNAPNTTTFDIQIGTRPTHWLGTLDMDGGSRAVFNQKVYVHQFKLSTGHRDSEETVAVFSGADRSRGHAGTVIQTVTGGARTTFQVKSGDSGDVQVEVSDFKKAERQPGAVNLLIDPGGDTTHRHRLRVGGWGLSYDDTSVVNDVGVDMSRVSSGFVDKGRLTGDVKFLSDVKVEGQVSIKAGSSGYAGAALFVARDAILHKDVVLDESAGEGQASFGVRAFPDYYTNVDEQTISGGHGVKITGQRDGQGAVRVTNGISDAAPSKTATFNVQIGTNASHRVRVLQVGDKDDANGTMNGGRAVFNRSVFADQVTLFAGNHTNEWAEAVFNDTLSAETVTLSERSAVRFEKPVSLSGLLRLNKNTTMTLGSNFGVRTGGDATAPFVTVGGYDFGTASADNKVTIVLPVTSTTGVQALFSQTLSSEQQRKLTIRESMLYTYKLGADGRVTVKEKSTERTMAESGVSREQAEVLKNAGKVIGRDRVLGVALEKAISNPAEAKKLTEQLAPQTESVTAAVSSTGGQVAGVTSNRLSALRSGGLYAATGQTGFATGGPGLEKAFWLKPFGSRGQQSKTKSVAGFAMKSSGLAFGLDAPIGEQARVGTALAYSTTKVKGKGVGQNKTDVKSWQVSVYGDYSTDSYYVEGQLGLGRNGVTATSKVATMTRRSSYRTTQVMASVGGGVPLSVGGSAVVTPTAGLSYSRMGSADYTTTGARGWNQKISVTALDSVVGSLGAKVHARLKQQTGTLVPTARVGLSYDFAGDRAVVSGKFTGGGNAFKVKGAKVKKLSGTAGVGLTYDAPRWSIGADYDLNARSGYKSHTAQLNAKIKF